MPTNVELVNKAKMVIADNFGLQISQQYEKFYSDKEDSVIVESLESLLTDVLGSEPAKNQLKKYKIIL